MLLLPVFFTHPNKFLYKTTIDYKLLHLSQTPEAVKLSDAVLNPSGREKEGIFKLFKQ